MIVSELERSHLARALWVAINAQVVQERRQNMPGPSGETMVWMSYLLEFKPDLKDKLDTIKDSYKNPTGL